jgi:hypothetical protein
MAEFSPSDLRSATQSAFSMRAMIFPMLLIGLDLGASVVYAVALDWRPLACGSSADRVRYVLSGALRTFTVRIKSP